MVVDVVQQGLPIDYIVFDTLHTGGWLTNKFSRLGLTSVGVYPSAIDPQPCSASKAAEPS
jgi:hypothetical protein